ncbi:phage tail tape measure protein [Fusobacterium gastrosuis]|uniref:phage tail tape measure protein n=1 Tax=Fusobacterium gastrosuis TaxID=1755100 RepID=UPI002978540D|nr:phage tail tape measure protein [Fusobacteriaceae bacterium]MDY5713635.1 phage tail tape measure protein [Fusobacterium gastrosuis]
MGKNLDILLKIVGQVDKTIPQSLREIAEETRKLKIRKQELEKQKKLMENEMRLKKELQGQISAMQANRNALKSLELAKKSGATLTKQEEERYRQLTAERKKLDKQVLSNYNSYKKYRMEVQKLKIPYDQLQREIDQSIIKMKDLENQQKRMKAQGQITNYVGGVKNKIGALKDNVVQKVKTTAMVGAGMATAGVITSAKSYIDFDKQMRKVRAISGATEEEFAMLSAEAERLGNTTKFTSAEAAAGMEKFALAGFKPKQIKEVLGGVLELAAASGEDFVMISDIISDHMKAFGLQTKDTGYMVDVLANTMSNSNVNIEQLGETLKFLSASAQNLKIDLSTTAAATGLMGDAAVKSGMAGRNLKSALSAMANEKVQQKMKALGITVKNSKGNFIGLANVIRQIDKATSKMGDVKKLGVLKDLFGEQGELAISKLLTAEKEIDGITYRGAEALEKFAAQNHNAQGKAKKMVEIMMENAGGRWDLFTSAIDSLKLTIGKTVFDNGGLSWLKTATKYINALTDVLANRTRNSKEHVIMQELVDNAKEAWKVIKDIGKAIYKVGEFINAIGVDNILLFITVFNITAKIVTFVGAIQKAMVTVKAAGGIMAALKTGIAALGGPLAFIVATVAMFGYIVYKNWDKIKLFFINLWQELKNVGKMVYDIFSIIFKDFYELIKWYINLFISFWKSIYEFIKTIFLAIWDTIKFVMESIVSGIKSCIDTIVAIWQSIVGVVNAVFSNIWDFLASKTSSIGEMFSNMWKEITDSFKNIWSGVKTYVSDIISTMLEKISGFKENFKNKVLEIASSIPGLSFFVKAKKEVDGSHRAGLDYVPYDGYIAELHKGERVLTAEENGSLYTDLSNALKQRKENTEKNINTKNSNPITIHFNPTFNGVSSDTAKDIIDAMQSKIEELENILRRVLEKGETDARISL